MPSYTLHNSTPYTKLFRAEPSYSDLRVFGCACYPLLRPYNKHKLEFRSKQCIFLGYSSNHKGYRCLDPSTSRIYLSRNVVFDENLFPAQSKVTTTLPPAPGHSPSTGTMLLPIHFYSLNSLPLSTHTAPLLCLLMLQGLPHHLLNRISTTQGIGTSAPFLTQSQYPLHLHQSTLQLITVPLACRLTPLQRPIRMILCLCLL